jgi:hypothetical protein
MKRSVAIAIGTALVFATGSSLAQDPKAPASSPSATATQPRASMTTSSPLGEMDQHTKNMQALHDRMMNATTPEERQKVMDEQRKEMQGSMGMMNQMMQGGTSPGGMGSGMMGQKGKPADTGAQMQMMQKRMDMMQMMMQTMMDQQGMMAGPQGMGATPKK